MAQIFPPGANQFARLSLLGAAAALVLALWLCEKLQASPYASGQDTAPEQPVQFSHKHHSGDDGLDCRYCHGSVEESRFAGLPPTETCLHCHTQIWAQSALLAPVHDSYRLNQPLRWTRVHDLPDFVAFDHSIHVHKGVGCSTCHGEVDRMPLVRPVASLHMEWCLDCHRHPERHLRPRSQIYNMRWQVADPEQQLALGRRLVAEYGVRGPAFLTSCDTCHR